MEKLKALFGEISGLMQSESIFLKILIAIILVFIGWNLVSFIASLIRNTLSKRNFDKTLLPFVVNIVLWSMRALLFITIASYIGIETTSFVAIIGAAGLAIGLALQGALANFAGGVLILINRPYKVADLVKMQGEIGVVKEIQIFNTILLSPENKTIILPNGAVCNGNITNFTVEGVIRVDISVGISYDADIKKAKKIIMDLMTSNENILKTPAPFVGVSELGDSSINLTVRPYSIPGDYWKVYFNLIEEIKTSLDAGGIEIPFPQVDVNISK